MKVKEEMRRRVGRKDRPTRYPRIGQHAQALGVSRTHLWCVLKGERQSRSLTARYRALVKEGGAA